MWIDGLASSLAFGALAAVLLVFAQNLGIHLPPGAPVLPLYLVGCLVLYSTLLAPTPRKAIRNGAVAAVAAAGLLVSTSSVVGVAVGATALLTLVRSGLDANTRRPRVFFFEATLGFLALSAAAWVAWPGWIGQAAALWSYFLVQSLFFLLPIVQEGGGSSESGDEFERARDHLMALLDDA